MMRACLGTGANDAEPIISLSQQGNVLAEDHTRKAGGPNAELAANALRGVGLGVKGFVLAWRSPEENENTSVRRGRNLLAASRLTGEELRHTQADASQGSNAEQIAAGGQAREGGHGFISWVRIPILTGLHAGQAGKHWTQP